MARALPTLSLVIPTRNEAENVAPLVAAICAAMPGSSKELVFVDDSDDATPGLLQRLLAQTDCPGLVLQRANSNRDGGLSTAVVRGIRASSGRYICTMDADLQHPASAIPLLLDAALRENADIVVGSRYLSGLRATDGFDGMGRYLVSRGARVAARTVLPAARWTTDPLSGFFLLRRAVVEGVDLRPIGYKILIEILVRGRWRRISDVEYAFHSRNAGVSKATLEEALQFARHVRELIGVPQSKGRERIERERRRAGSREAIPACIRRIELTRTNGHPAATQVEVSSNGASVSGAAGARHALSPNGAEHLHAGG